MRSTIVLHCGLIFELSVYLPNLIWWEISTDSYNDIGCHIGRVFQKNDSLMEQDILLKLVLTI